MADFRGSATQKLFIFSKCNIANHTISIFQFGNLFSEKLFISIEPPFFKFGRPQNMKFLEIRAKLAIWGENPIFLGQPMKKSTCIFQNTIQSGYQRTSSRLLHFFQLNSKWNGLFVYEIAVFGNLRSRTDENLTKIGNLGQNGRFSRVHHRKVIYFFQNLIAATLILTLSSLEIILQLSFK